MVCVLGKVKGKLEYDISNCDARGGTIWNGRVDG